MALEFNKINNKPSIMKNGVYVVDPGNNLGTINLNGLASTDDLERFSLGNWNSIVKNDKIFPSAHRGLVSNIEQGRPVQFSFVPVNIIRYNIVSGTEQGHQLHPLITIKDDGVNHHLADSDQTIRNNLNDGNAFPNEMLAQLFNVLTTGPGGWTFGALLSSRSINYEYAYIQKMSNTDSPTFQVSFNSEIKSLMNSIHNWSWTFTINQLNQIKYVLNLDGIFDQDGNLVGTIAVPNVQMRLSDIGTLITVPINPGGYNPSSGIINLQTTGIENAPSEFGYPDFAPNFTPSTSLTIPEVNFKVISFGGPGGMYSKDLEAQPDLTTSLYDTATTPSTTAFSYHADADPYQWFTSPRTTENFSQIITYAEGGEKIGLYSNTTGTARFWIKIPNNDLVNGKTYKITGFGSNASSANRVIAPYLIVGTSWHQGHDYYLGESPVSALGEFEVNFAADFEKFPDTHYLFFYISDQVQYQPTWLILENVKIFNMDEYILRDSVDSTINRNALLYYDKEEDKFIETSYPLKVYLGVDVFGVDDFTNETEIMSEESKWMYINLFYNDDPSEMENVFTAENLEVINSVFHHEVIQWGDEKVLLSDDDILNSEYFSIYDFEGFLSPTDFKFKRFNQSQLIYSKSIVNDDKINLVSHTYHTPGTKSIKIIVYRYTKDLSFLIETILVTKNIVINDGTLLSQDFEIFGGTDFNFLPLKSSEAIIGGLYDNSKYITSVEKIIKDDIYDEEDFLKRKTNLEFFEKFTEGDFGNLKDKMDLGVTRVFKGTSDIYDFLMTDEQKGKAIADEFPNFSDNFYGEDDKVKFNSEATDIFINDGDTELKQNCMIEINPQKMEYLTIPNTVGDKDKGILIGDYKIKKEKNQPFQKEGIMEISLLEDDSQKQAF